MSAKTELAKSRAKLSKTTADLKSTSDAIAYEKTELENLEDRIDKTAEDNAEKLEAEKLEMQTKSADEQVAKDGREIKVGIWRGKKQVARERNQGTGGVVVVITHVNLQVHGGHVMAQ